MSWRRDFRRLAGILLGTILPSACANCGRPGEIFCADCRAKVVPISFPVCRQCGRPQLEPIERCYSCWPDDSVLSQSRAAVIFAPPVRRVIHRFKYDGLFALADPLAELMAEAWPTRGMTADLVLPVPLHPRRERRRGFNQSERLVAALMDRLGWVTSPGAIRRRRHTRPQTHLPAEQRKGNVSGAFWADEAQVSGKRILLVDDVFTTGSTLNAAAEALLEAGAGSVSAYCLSLAPSDDDHSPVSNDQQTL